jgi:hypothetical protein|tara:strand:- start:1429 stop:1647 length:219 start_codon:yes stop_codon:yes gene_type:complete
MEPEVKLLFPLFGGFVLWFALMWFSFKLDGRHKAVMDRLDEMSERIQKNNILVLNKIEVLENTLNKHIEGCD